MIQSLSTRSSSSDDLTATPVSAEIANSDLFSSDEGPGASGTICVGGSVTAAMRLWSDVSVLAGVLSDPPNFDFTILILPGGF